MLAFRGLLERLGALYFELVLQEPHSPREDAFFARAVGHFEAAQKAAARTPFPVRTDYRTTCTVLLYNAMQPGRRRIHC